VRALKLPPRSFHPKLYGSQAMLQLCNQRQKLINQCTNMMSLLASGPALRQPWINMISPKNWSLISSTSPRCLAVANGQLYCNEKILASVQTRQEQWPGQCFPMCTDLYLDLLPTEQKYRYYFSSRCSDSVTCNLRCIASRL